MPDADLYSLPAVRLKPIYHAAVDAPLCRQCCEADLTFFDPRCSGCSAILYDPKTSISQLFAIVRQWVPQVQQNISLFVNEILKRGAHINDTDGLTDMTLLHYVSKSGAAGVGDAMTACDTLQLLISKGANVIQKCRWTDMLPLHYACFFDVSGAVRIILEANSSDINTRCKEFNNGTSLHIACTNLCFETAKILLQYGADTTISDKDNKIPSQWIMNGTSDDVIGSTAIAKSLHSLLATHGGNNSPTNSSSSKSLDSPTMKALGLAIGDTVNGVGHVGKLRYCGGTEFSPGQWAGIELQHPKGKNDGSVDGVAYFTCQSAHGIFVPLSKVKKVHSDDALLKIAIENIKEECGQKGRRYSPEKNATGGFLDSKSSILNLGTNVTISGQKQGIVRFVGETNFAPGHWVGVELEEPLGKNDGAVAGVRYFSCSPFHGIFASPAKISISPHNDATSTPSNEFVDNRNQELSISPMQLSPSPTLDQDDSIASANSRIPVRNKDKQIPKGKESTIKRLKENNNNTNTKTDLRLKEGMSVYLNNELGIVRYIGNVAFGEGKWLGVELRRPNGKNDGSVGGKRYFTCKANHGLLVKPTRATCRGINCSQLMGNS